MTMVVCFMTIMIVFNSNHIIRSSTPALQSCCLEMLEDCVPRPGVSYRKAMQWSQTSHKTRITRQIYMASSTSLCSLVFPRMETKHLVVTLKFCLNSVFSFPNTILLSKKLNLSQLMFPPLLLTDF